MSVATGTPVFVTVGGDASAATATYTPSGANTATTVTLSTIAQNASDALVNAESASKNASAAVTASNTASQTAGSALTVANASLQPSAIWAASGVAGTNSSGDLSIPDGKSLYVTTGQFYQCSSKENAASALYQMGYAGCNRNHTWQVYSGSNSTGYGYVDFVTYFQGGTGNFDGTQYIRCSSILPATTNSLTLGSSSNAFAGLFLQSAATVVSDINHKTNIELLNSDVDGIASSCGVTTPSDHQAALFSAIRSVPFCLFTYKAGKRIHVGTIAQFVEAAFKKYDLNPADYGLWGEDEQTETTFETKDNDTTITSQVVTDSAGEPVKKQTLRMEEFLSLKLAQIEYDLSSKTSA